jgi:hypothetical protein
MFLRKGSLVLVLLVACAGLAGCESDSRSGRGLFGMGGGDSDDRGRAQRCVDSGYERGSVPYRQCVETGRGLSDDD